MNSSVIVFPGSNCDRDIAQALKKLQFKNKMVWHKDSELPKSDLIVIPGGFSYGDYLRAGAIARFSPVMNEVIKSSKKGIPIIGICNGFQVLTESGLLPGTLMVNNSVKFISKDVILILVQICNHSIFYNVTMRNSNYETYETLPLTGYLIQNNKLIRDKSFILSLFSSSIYKNE